MYFYLLNRSLLFYITLLHSIFSFHNSYSSLIHSYCTFLFFYVVVWVYYKVDLSCALANGREAPNPRGTDLRQFAGRFRVSRRHLVPPALWSFPGHLGRTSERSGGVFWQGWFLSYATHELKINHPQWLLYLGILIFYLTNYIYLHFFIAVSKLISVLFKAYLWFNRLDQMATDLLSFLDFHIPSYFLRNHAPFYAPYHPTFYGYNYLMHRVCFVAQTRLFDIRYLLFRFFQMLIVYNFFHYRFV